MDKIIILEPKVTEKSSIQLEKNVYQFKIKKEATKVDVKRFLETLYEVKVKSVNIANVKPKKRIRGRIKGLTTGYKKAYVTLQEGYKIEEIKKQY